MKKLSHRAVWCLTLFLIASGSLFAQDKEALQKKRDELNKQIQITGQLLKETQQTQKTTQNELQLTSSKINLRKELINNIAQEVKSINSEMTANKERIAELENDLTRLREEYAQMIYRAYVNRNVYDKLLFIFSADDFFQALKRTRYINQYGEYRERQAELIKRTANEIAQKQEELLAQKAEKELLLENERSEQVKLNEDLRKQQSMLANLQGETKKLKQQLSKQEAERNKLNKEIQRIIEAEIAAAKKDKGGVFSLTPEAAALSASFENNKGKLPWPVERGVVTGTFGTHKHPVLPGIMIENNGIDISTSKGAAVRSIFEGTVTSVFTIPGAGKNVIISHGAYRSVYTNLLEVFVTTGEKVSTKQSIGILQTDEEDGKTIAHLEIWKISGSGTTKQNPGLWIFK